MKKLLLASIGLLWAMSFAYSVPTGPMTPGYTTTGDNWIAVTPSTPLPVTGAFSATITGSSSTASNAVFTDETTFTPGTSVFTPIGGIFITSGTSNLTLGQQGAAILTTNRALSVDAITNSALLAAVSAPIPTQASTVPIGGVGLFIQGSIVTNSNPVPVIVSSFTSATINATIVTSPTLVVVPSSQYPVSSTPLHASATGTTAAVTVTLTADAGQINFICGFSIRSNATAALTGNATVTGLVNSSTGNFTEWVAPNASGLGVAEEIFTPCLPGNAINTAISVVSAAPLTSGITSVDVWGYKKAVSP